MLYWVSVMGFLLQPPSSRRNPARARGCVQPWLRFSGTPWLLLLLNFHLQVCCLCLRAAGSPTPLPEGALGVPMRGSHGCSPARAGGLWVGCSVRAQRSARVEAVASRSSLVPAFFSGSLPLNAPPSRREFTDGGCWWDWEGGKGRGEEKGWP